MLLYFYKLSLKVYSLFLQWNISVNSLSSLVSMPINPLNVTKLLLVAFQTMNIPESEVNDAERQLADHFNEILQGAFQNKRDWAKIETTGALFW